MRGIGMFFRCPACGGKSVGQVGVDQYYCWDCFVEFNQNNEIFQIGEDGTLIQNGIAQSR